MNRERLQKMEEIVHAALEHTPENQRSFVLQCCGEDTDLRRQVELLLAKAGNAGSFLAAPASVGSTMTLTAHSPISRQFGSYRIISPLGAGGMGEVYRAYDAKLGREVAIKILPAEFARNRERLLRFRREARTLASLNHPNIAAIYGVEESGGADGLVLELVEGETLRGPLPLAAALRAAGQIAEALEAAHEHGIVHRDLKPANVKITPQGRVKVLDFGLAKAIMGAAADRDSSRTASLLGGETLAGHVLGTPGYMSPEQACGKEVDQRTDIWAFGCLLYELLSGRRAFQGETQMEMLAAVLDREPDWQALPPETPPEIRDLLRRCLQKEAGHRLNNIAEARRTIDGAQAHNLNFAPLPPVGASTAPGIPRRIVSLIMGHGWDILQVRMCIWCIGIAYAAWRFRLAAFPGRWASPCSMLP